MPSKAYGVHLVSSSENEYSSNSVPQHVHYGISDTHLMKNPALMVIDESLASDGSSIISKVNDRDICMYRDYGKISCTTICNTLSLDTISCSCAVSNMYIGLVLLLARQTYPYSRLIILSCQDTDEDAALNTMIIVFLFTAYIL